MKNQTTQDNDNYTERNEEVTERAFTGEDERKPIKAGIDLFVFTLVITSLLIDLMVISNETLIEDSVTLSFIAERISIVFVILLANRVKKDPQYNYAYFFLGALSSIVIEIIASMVLSDYLSTLNLYRETVITGILRAFIWGYFYRSFKIYSMKKLFG